MQQSQGAANHSAGGCPAAACARLCTCTLCSWPDLKTLGPLMFYSNLCAIRMYKVWKHCKLQASFSIGGKIENNVLKLRHLSIKIAVFIASSACISFSNPALLWRRAFVCVIWITAGRCVCVLACVCPCVFPLILVWFILGACQFSKKKKSVLNKEVGKGELGRGSIPRKDNAEKKALFWDESERRLLNAAEQSQGWIRRQEPNSDPRPYNQINKGRLLM